MNKYVYVCTNTRTIFFSSLHFRRRRRRRAGGRDGSKSHSPPDSTRLSQYHFYLSTLRPCTRTRSVFVLAPQQVTSHAGESSRANTMLALFNRIRRDFPRSDPYGIPVSTIRLRACVFVSYSGVYIYIYYVRIYVLHARVLH